MRRPMQRIGFVVTPGFQMMYFAALSVFEFANLSAGEPVYEIEVLSEHGGPVASSVGVAVDTRPFGDPAFDTLLVSGNMQISQASPGLIDFVRQAQGRSRRIGSICTGAFVLAEAGILD